MNMNKVLMAGLVAAVVAAPAMSSQCRSGGWNVGAEVGMRIAKMKLPSDGKLAGSDKNASIKKNKAQFCPGLFFGWDHRFNDAVFGVKLATDISCGKIKKEYNGWTADRSSDHDVAVDKDEVTVKNNWNVMLTPTIGYMVTPEFEIHALAGLKLAHYKVTYSDTQVDPTVADRGKSTSAKKVKFSPVVGAELVYNITPDWFVKLNYTYEFKAKPKMPADLSKHATDSEGGGNANAMKMQAHVIKLGFGARF
jgi:opacity protein-like surface antigen